MPHAMQSAKATCRNVAGSLPSGLLSTTGVVHRRRTERLLCFIAVLSVHVEEDTITMRLVEVLAAHSHHAWMFHRQSHGCEYGPQRGRSASSPSVVVTVGQLAHQQRRCCHHPPSHHCAGLHHQLHAQRRAFPVTPLWTAPPCAGGEADGEREGVDMVSRTHSYLMSNAEPCVLSAENEECAKKEVVAGVVYGTSTVSVPQLSASRRSTAPSSSSSSSAPSSSTTAQTSASTKKPSPLLFPFELLAPDDQTSNRMTALVHRHCWRPLVVVVLFVSHTQ